MDREVVGTGTDRPSDGGERPVVRPLISPYHYPLGEWEGLRVGSGHRYRPPVTFGERQVDGRSVNEGTSLGSIGLNWFR